MAEALVLERSPIGAAQTRHGTEPTCYAIPPTPAWVKTHLRGTTACAVLTASGVPTRPSPPPNDESPGAGKSARSHIPRSRVLASPGIPDAQLRAGTHPPCGDSANNGTFVRRWQASESPRRSRGSQAVRHHNGRARTVVSQNEPPFAPLVGS